VDYKQMRFGVEVEYVGMGTEEGCCVVAEHLNWTRDNSNIIDPRGGDWDFRDDGSLSDNDGECGSDNVGEMVTPPLYYKDIGFLQEAVRALKAAGAYVNETCGVHVHVESSYLSDRALARLVNLMHRHQNELYQALEVLSSRREAYCKPVRHGLVQTIRYHRKSLSNFGSDGMKSMWYGDPHAGSSQYDGSRYYSLNLHSHWYRGTVEFRFFNGTLHAGKIRSYVVLALHMVKKAAEGDGIGNGDPLRTVSREQALKRLRRFIYNLGIKGAEFENCRLHLCNGLLKHRKDLSCAD